MISNKVEISYIIPDSNIIIDYWKPIEDEKHFRFMTHLGTETFQEIKTITTADYSIYTSIFNKWYLVTFYKIPENRIIVLKTDESFELFDENLKIKFKVTSYNANYCVGSLMFLFQGSFGNILYTGFFRPTSSCNIFEHRVLKEIIEKRELTEVYIDNTYAAEYCNFPTRAKVVKELIDLILSKPNHKIIISGSRLGKEEVLLDVAVSLKEKIVVSQAKFKLFRMVGLEEYFTTCDADSRIHAYDRIINMRECTRRQCRSGPHVVILLTARYEFEKFKNEETDSKPPGLYIFPYSRHCSHSELMQFLSTSKPRTIKPILNYADGDYSLPSIIIPKCMFDLCRRGDHIENACDTEDCEFNTCPDDFGTEDVEFNTCNSFVREDDKFANVGIDGCAEESRVIENVVTEDDGTRAETNFVNGLQFARQFNELRSVKNDGERRENIASPSLGGGGGGLLPISTNGETTLTSVRRNGIGTSEPDERSALKKSPILDERENCAGNDTYTIETRVNVNGDDNVNVFPIEDNDTPALGDVNDARVYENEHDVGKIIDDRDEANDDVENSNKNGDDNVNVLPIVLIPLLEDDDDTPEGDVNDARVYRNEHGAGKLIDDRDKANDDNQNPNENGDDNVNVLPIVLISLLEDDDDTPEGDVNDARVYRNEHGAGKLIDDRDKANDDSQNPNENGDDNVFPIVSIPLLDNNSLRGSVDRDKNLTDDDDDDERKEKQPGKVTSRNALKEKSCRRIERANDGSVVTLLTNDLDKKTVIEDAEIVVSGESSDDDNADVGGDFPSSRNENAAENDDDDRDTIEHTIRVEWTARRDDDACIGVESSESRGSIGLLFSDESTCSDDVDRELPPIANATPNENVRASTKRADSDVGKLVVGNLNPREGETRNSDKHINGNNSRSNRNRKFPRLFRGFRNEDGRAKNARTRGEEERRNENSIGGEVLSTNELDEAVIEDTETAGVSPREDVKINELQNPNYEYSCNSVKILFRLPNSCNENVNNVRENSSVNDNQREITGNRDCDCAQKRDYNKDIVSNLVQYITKNPAACSADEFERIIARKKAKRARPMPPDIPLPLGLQL